MSLPIILHIETSTNVCSVALSEGESCLFSISNSEGLNHAALLSSFIEKALNQLGSRKPDAVAVSSGPGSYTGLRIGVSTAKGLCFGYGIPLIAVDTLRIMSIPAIKKVNNAPENALFCPMIDARRMEVYDALFQKDGTMVQEVKADIIDENSFADLLQSHTVYFLGNGAEKCKSVLTHPNAHFIENIYPLAENMIELANKAFESNKFVDTAYYEPFYLKEFQATTPKKVISG